MRGVPRILLFLIGLELTTISVLDITMFFQKTNKNKFTKLNYI